MAEFKGTREAFAAALYEMAAENDKVVGVFPDSLKAMRAVLLERLIRIVTSSVVSQSSAQLM